ncbi:hypothetical protein BKA66DRAFT_596788 [Pyrenochaeta sp. MPI-SDFR-AT-0127]|nr:hypothetical protein BKA66DRAFT_596788 [Pyrenochaeta sp. MPI-SDFR-AT-0127]
MPVTEKSLYAIGICFVAGGIAQTTSSRTASPANYVTSSITPAPTHPPIPTANTPALPAEFSDIPQSVINCWDAHANYSTASRFLYTELLSSASYSWSSWSTTAYSLSPYLNGFYSCRTIAIPSISTLCDGYPRASTFSSTCQTVTETYTWTITGQAYYYTPAWSTELEQLPSPTCTVASDLGPECSRLRDAYSWRKTHLQSQIPSPTGSVAGPGCSVLNTADPSAKPTCLLEGGEWEAFYWPTPIPTGSAFCDTNATIVTATPTIPGQPITAVVSGLTLTSPSVYHFLRNATLKTFAGHASLIGDISSGYDAFSPSTTPAFLTVAQHESDILTISRLCAGSNSRRYCTFHASPGFSIADQITVRASEYCGKQGCDSSRTIYQDEYKPTLGVPLSEMMAQNHLFSDCTWTMTGVRVRTAGPPVYSVGRVKAVDWHTITTASSGASNFHETMGPRLLA